MARVSWPYQVSISKFIKHIAFKGKLLSTSYVFCNQVILRRWNSDIDATTITHSLWPWPWYLDLHNLTSLYVAWTTPSTSLVEFCKKVKVEYLLQCCLHDSWPEALYNVGSGSWLAWANDAVAHYVAGHPTGSAVQRTDIPPPQLATLGLHPIAHKLLLISHPAKDRRLSWPEHTIG